MYQGNPPSASLSSSWESNRNTLIWEGPPRSGPDGVVTVNGYRCTNHSEGGDRVTVPDRARTWHGRFAAENPANTGIPRQGRGHRATVSHDRAGAPWQGEQAEMITVLLKNKGTLVPRPPVHSHIALLGKKGNG